MLEKYLPLIGVAGLILLVGGYFFITVPREAARMDALAFSNTSTWDPHPLQVSQEATIYPEEMFAAIALPPPPKNSSPEVARELAELMSDRALRTPQEIQDIIGEASTQKAGFGGYPMGAYMDPKQFPATAALLTDIFHDVEVIEMQQKRKFDRVRPSALDSALDTVIPVPGFPAYPSYHSTETHFFAYVFSELAPARKNEFIARADQISHNREIAGVHYPSDTRAGVLLAQQFFTAAMGNTKFQKLLVAAKAEWVADGLTRAISSPAITN